MPLEPFIVSRFPGVFGVASGGWRAGVLIILEVSLDNYPPEC